MADQDQTARNRWAVIQAMRLGGVAMAVVGLLVTGDVILLPRVAGYVLLAIGLLDVFVVPTLLARKWSTRRALDEPRDKR